MKKIINYLSLLLCVLVVVSCDREKLDYGGNKGDDEKVEGQMVELNLRGVLKVDVQQTRVPKATRAIATDDFVVSLFDVKKKEVGTWVYKEMPELISVVEGNYYIKTFSHVLQPVDTRAYYEGLSTEFTVSPGAITEVQPIVCAMKNIEIKPIFDEALIGYLGKDVAVTVSVGDAVYTYTDIDNLSTMYFAPTSGETSVVYVTFTGTVDGFKENFKKTYTAASGDALDVTFTLKNVTPDGEIINSGTASMKLKLDLSVTVIDKECNVKVAEEIIEEEGGDEGDGDDTNTKPVIMGRDFDIKEAQIVPVGDQGMTCIVDITAINRISNLFVTIDSETLTEKVLNEVGLLKSFDLAYPGKLESALGKDEHGDGLGFPVSSQVIGQKNLVFDITPFTPLLNIYGAATHKFIIKVVDQKGNYLEQTLTLITK